MCGCLLAAPSAAAQELLDRVVARVGSVTIMQSDVNAAVGLGLVTVPPDDRSGDAAVQQLIDRELALAEVNRFVPPEPATDSVDAEVARLRARAGTGLELLMRQTGLDDARLRELARDTLRIQAYLAQRFGNTVQVSDNDVVEFYRANPDVFTRNGVLLPFDEVETLARERAAVARRATVVDQWMRDLRARGSVTRPPVRP
jgi:hypothetical protein